MSYGAVLVTGASSGIGRACAMRLDKRGFRVFAGVRKEANGTALRKAASGRLTPVLLDVTDMAAIATAAETIADIMGDDGLAGLVNNAGIALTGPLEFLPIAEVRRQLEVNVIGQIAVTQAMLPLLRKAKGRVVFIGSIGGRMAVPFLGPYSASKFALEALTDSLRQELRPWGMQVAIIEPSSVATPIWEKSLAMADTLIRELPPEAHRLYDPAIATVRKATVKAGGHGVPASRVAKAVVHALTAPRPRTRYLVGRDAYLEAVLAKIVPDRLRDRLIAQEIGLPEKL